MCRKDNLYNRGRFEIKRECDCVTDLCTSYADRYLDQPQ